MSYIRSGSNPEGMYIWGDGITVYFASGGEDTSQRHSNMPSGVFHELIRRYHKRYDFDTPVSYKGASLKGCWDGGKPKIKLSYNGWEYIMFMVTWDYIAYRNLENVNRMVRNKRNKITLP